MTPSLIAAARAARYALDTPEVTAAFKAMRDHIAEVTAKADAVLNQQREDWIRAHCHKAGFEPTPDNFHRLNLRTHQEMNSYTTTLFIDGRVVGVFKLRMVFADHDLEYRTSAT